MPWKKTDNLMHKSMNRHGLGDMLLAGQVCLKAEQLYPGLFKAISVKNGCLHLEIARRDQIRLTMIQGKLIEELKAHSQVRNLPLVDRIRLTFLED